MARCQNRIGPTVRISVCQRACSVTSRTLDVSRYKVLCVMSFRMERGDVLVQQTGLPVAHKLRASSHSFLCTQNFDRTGAAACNNMHVATCALAWCCDRSQGEYLPHQPKSLEEQCGRRGRRCSCRRPAGNGFDVQEVCDQGVCLLSPQMSLHKVV